MTTWMDHEKIFLVPPYANKVKGNFALKIQILAMIVTVLAVLDHYVYFISAVKRVEHEIKDCDDTKRDFWRILYINERQVFFTVLPYHSWQIPFLEWYEVIKTMCWTYSEIFVSSVSVTLANRFQQFTNRLKCYEKRYLSDSYWHELRCHYNILCNLTMEADAILSPFILVYCFSNLFFLLQKVFTNFEKDAMQWEKYYSYYSSTFLICRTIALLYFGASVNEKAREILKVLREVPSKTYGCLDVMKKALKAFIKF